MDTARGGKGGVMGEAVRRSLHDGRVGWLCSVQCPPSRVLWNPVASIVLFEMRTRHTAHGCDADDGLAGGRPLGEGRRATAVAA